MRASARLRLRCAAGLAVLLVLLAVVPACGPDQSPTDEKTEPGPGKTAPDEGPPSLATVTAVDEEEGLSATLTARPAAAFVGDRIVVELALEAPEGYRVLSVPERLAPLTVVDAEEVKTPEGDSVWRWEAAAFEVGPLAVGPLEVSWVTDQGEESTLEIDPLEMTIVSVLDEDPEKAELADIRGPVEIPIDWGWWGRAGLVAFLVALVVVLLLLVGARWLRRRREGVEARERPLEPAHVVALRRLEALEAEGPPGAERLKPYYVEMSEAVRAYLERRFMMEALERTTEEMSFLLRSSGLRRDLRERLLAWLARCDLVKFAQARPSSAQIRADLEEAIAFVRQTAPRPETEVPEAAPSDGGGRREAS